MGNASVKETEKNKGEHDRSQRYHHTKRHHHTHKYHAFKTRRNHHRRRHFRGAGSPLKPGHKTPENKTKSRSLRNVEEGLHRSVLVDQAHMAEEERIKREKEEKIKAKRKTAKEKEKMKLEMGKKGKSWEEYENS